MARFKYSGLFSGLMISRCALKARCHAFVRLAVFARLSAVDYLSSVSQQCRRVSRKQTKERRLLVGLIKNKNEGVPGYQSPAGKNCERRVNPRSQCLTAISSYGCRGPAAPCNRAAAWFPQRFGARAPTVCRTFPKSTLIMERDDWKRAGVQLGEFAHTVYTVSLLLCRCVGYLHFRADSWQQGWRSKFCGTSRCAATLISPVRTRTRCPWLIFGHGVGQRVLHLQSTMWRHVALRQWSKYKSGHRLHCSYCRHVPEPNDNHAARRPWRKHTPWLLVPSQLANVPSHLGIRALVRLIARSRFTVLSLPQITHSRMPHPNTPLRSSSEFNKLLTPHSHRLGPPTDPIPMLRIGISSLKVCERSSAKRLSQSLPGNWMWLCMWCNLQSCSVQGFDYKILHELITGVIYWITHTRCLRCSICDLQGWCKSDLLPCGVAALHQAHACTSTSSCWLSRSRYQKGM